MSVAIPEQIVSDVVQAVSGRMSDPNYAQVAIGSFAQAHPDAGRFITAHVDELGGSDGIVHAVFHAEVLHECFRRHLGRALPPVGFVDLDEASQGDVVARFTAAQPGLASYVASNVEVEPLKKLLALVGLAMAAVA